MLHATHASQGFQDVQTCPATPLVIFFVNVGTVWGGGLLARTNLRGAGLNFYGNIVVNAAVHIAPFILSGFTRYNPGLLTALIMFVPATYLCCQCMLKAHVCSTSGLLRALLVGAITHVVIVTSLLALSRGTISEGFTCFVQVLNLLPVLLVTKPV